MTLLAVLIFSRMPVYWFANFWPDLQRMPMTRKSKIPPPVRARMQAAGYDDWVIEQAAKGRTARQRLARELIEPDPEDVADSQDSSVSRDAVLT
jgi:hypothetical protein